MRLRSEKATALRGVLWEEPTAEQWSGACEKAEELAHDLLLEFPAVISKDMAKKAISAALASH